MELEQALAELELTDAEDLSPDKVRRAYMRQVRAHPPERDPGGFQRVRSAYELLQGVDQPAARTPQPAAPTAVPTAAPSLEIADNAEPPEADSDSTADVAETPGAEEERDDADTLIAIYERATPISPVPPTGVTFNTTLDLFIAGDRATARRLLAAFEHYSSLVGGLNLGPHGTAYLQLLRELSALSHAVRRRLTRALARSIRSGEFDTAVPALQAELEHQGEGRLARVMQRRAPSIFAATWKYVSRRRSKRTYGGGYFWLRLGFFGLVGLARLCSVLLNKPDQGDSPLAYKPTNGSVAPAAAIASDSAANPEANPSLSGAPAVEALAARGAHVSLTVEQKMRLGELRSKVEKQYLAGECDDLRDSWPKYLAASSELKRGETVVAEYHAQRVRAINACPDLATELPEQP